MYGFKLMKFNSTIKDLVRRTIVNQTHQINEDSIIRSNKFDYSSNQNKSKIHPFNNLFPWTSLTEFVDVIEKRIVFNDGNLIAIDKPWGVAYHKANKTIYKPYSFETLSLIRGEPKFCFDDALPSLEQRLNIDKLELIKSIDRYSSGIILFSGNSKAKPSIRKALQTNKVLGDPYLNFVCIAQGFPAISGNELSEKVRIKLMDVDEFADYREPIIVEPTYKKQEINNGYLARVFLKINSINRLNSSSYLNVKTNRLKWNFARCYVANKASFIIGDLRFSANVKRLLGEQVLETTNSFYKNNRIEPLNKEVRKALNIRSNRQVPIMLHLESVSLKNYRNKDILIQCKLPDHFSYALKKLKLVNSTDESENSS